MPASSSGADIATVSSRSVVWRRVCSRLPLHSLAVLARSSSKMAVATEIDDVYYDACARQGAAGPLCAQFGAPSATGFLETFFGWTSRMLVVYGATIRGQTGKITQGDAWYGSADGVPAPVLLDGGGFHTVALSATGQLFSWGAGMNGELGDGRKSDSASPVCIRSLSGKNVRELCAGLHHTLAVTSDGMLWAWGLNTSGQLGVGGCGSRSGPSHVKMGVPVVRVGAGWAHSAALSDRGVLYTWGNGSCGRLGHGDEQDAYTPKQLVCLAGLAAQKLALGGAHTAILTGTREVYVWGEGGDGQLGDCVPILKGMVRTSFKPILLKQLSGQVVDLASGARHCAVVTLSGMWLTWGCAQSGQLGHCATGMPDSGCSIPTVVTASGDNWRSCYCAGHSCIAVSNDGKFCVLGEAATEAARLGCDESSRKPGQVHSIRIRRNGVVHNVVDAFCGNCHYGLVLQASREEPDEQSEEAPPGFGAGECILFGGADEWEEKDAVHVFNVSTRSWEKNTSLMAPRAGSCASFFPSSRRTVVVGGHANGAFLKTCEFYDHCTGVASQGPSMLHARSGAVAGTVGDSVLVCGGCSGPEVLWWVEILRDGGACWEETARMKHHRYRACGAALSDRIVVCGGFDGTEKSIIDSCEVFDASNICWSSLAPLPQAVMGAGASSLSRKALLSVGGRGKQGYTDSVNLYSSDNDKWTSLPHMPVPQMDVSVVALSDVSALCFGGSDDEGWNDSVHLFDMRAPGWIPLGVSCPSPMSLMSAVHLRPN